MYTNICLETCICLFDTDVYWSMSCYCLFDTDICISFYLLLIDIDLEHDALNCYCSNTY